MNIAASLAIVGVDQEADALVVHWSDGRTEPFHYVWLRDNDPRLRTANGQILHDPFRFPFDVRPVDLGHDSGSLTIRWSDGHGPSGYSSAWLARHSYDPASVARRRPVRTSWAVPDIEGRLRKHDYAHVAEGGDGLRDVLQDVWDFGFGMMRGVPERSGVVLDVVKLFGFPRLTNYGDMYELLAKPEAEDRGNDTAFLPSHVDNPYRDPIPTVQLLHFINNSVTGGESTIVDGIRVAEEVRAHSRRYFDLLARVPVRYRYVDDQVDLMHEGPIIRTNSRGDIIGLLASPINIQPFDCAPGDMQDFYGAYRFYGATVESPRFRLKTKMMDGDLILMDNTRVLHGRTAFESNGIRRVQGCYSDYDALWSKLAKLGGQTASRFL